MELWMMEAEPGLILAIVGTGVALAALNMTQMAGLRRDLATLRNDVRGEIAELRQEVKELRQELKELRHEVNNLGNRVARLEGVLDMIRMGM